MLLLAVANQVCPDSGDTDDAGVGFEVVLVDAGGALELVLRSDAIASRLQSN